METQINVCCAFKIMHQTCQMFVGQSAHVIIEAFENAQKFQVPTRIKISRSIWRKLTLQGSKTINLSPTEILLKKVGLAFHRLGERVSLEEREEIKEYANIVKFH